MSVLGVFDRRFRGFRVIEIGGVGVLLALILLVYLAKTIAGSESARIDSVQQQIADERNRVSLLRAEVASLEQPERLEALSGRYLGLQPVDAKHEIDAQALAQIAHAGAPTPPAGGATPQVAAPQATMPANATTPAVAAPAKTAAAAQPMAAKPVKLAVAAPKPSKPVKLAVARIEEPAAPEPPAGRPSELKAPALDPIGALTPTDGGQ
jgi:hypothetical protein